MVTWPDTDQTQTDPQPDLGLRPEGLGDGLPGRARARGREISEAAPGRKREDALPFLVHELLFFISSTLEKNWSPGFVSPRLIR